MLGVVLCASIMNALFTYWYIKDWLWITCFSDLDKIYDAKLTKTLKKFTIKPITQVNGHLQHEVYFSVTEFSIGGH